MVSLVAPVQVQACGEAGFIEIAKGTFTYNGQSSIGDAPKGVVLDMDSSVSPTHGEQEMSVWNGHTIVHCCVCGCRKQESFVEINRRSFPDVIIEGQSRLVRLVPGPLPSQQRWEREIHAREPTSKAF
jgi:hypothetical protein